MVSFPFAFGHKIGSAVLVAKSMAANANRRSPVWHQARHVRHYDGLAENRSVQYVTDGTIRRFPHLFKAEFLNPLFIRGNGSAFDTYTILQYGICSINGHLVVGFVAVLNTQVIIFYIQVQVGNINLSFINFHIIRVISSPSSSTTGFSTLIFDILIFWFLMVSNI